jgi:hypothetical protein
VIRIATSSDDLAMIAASRTFRFEMTISVEPGHVAYLDPEWAADAAASALTDGYGIDAYYGDIATLDPDEASTKSGNESERQVRSYRFSVTFDVGPEHVAYDDPEWAADAAHGSLTNEYGIVTVYGPPRLFVDQ